MVLTTIQKIYRELLYVVATLPRYINQRQESANEWKKERDSRAVMVQQQVKNSSTNKAILAAKLKLSLQNESDARVPVHHLQGGRSVHSPTCLLSETTVNLG